MFTKIVYSTVRNLMASQAVVQNRVHELTEAAAILLVDVGLNGFPDRLVPRFKAGSVEVFVRPISLRREKADIGNRDFALGRLPQRQRKADGAKDRMRTRVAAWRFRTPIPWVSVRHGSA